MNDDVQKVKLLLGKMREHAYWKGRRDELVLEGLSRGMSARKIAVEMGIDRRTVYDINKRLGIT